MDTVLCFPLFVPISSQAGACQDMAKTSLTKTYRFNAILETGGPFKFESEMSAETEG